MPMGMKNLLTFMDGDFKFYCLQLKNPVRISRNSNAFPSGDGSLVQFYNGNNFQVVFSDEFLANFFQWVGGPTRSVIHRGV